MSCDFCKILINNPNELYRDELVTVLIDKDPISKGHIIVLPNQHAGDLDDLPEEVCQHIFRVARIYVTLLKEKFHPAGYSIMHNGGAFNDIAHFHLHVFPRFNNSEFSWQFQECRDNDAFNITYLKSILEYELKTKLNS